MPEELELKFEAIAHLFDGQKKEVVDPENISGMSAVIERLNKMIGDAQVSEADLQKVVASKGHYKEDEPITNYSDEFITRWIIPNWEKIVKTIKNKKGEQ